MYTNQGAKGTRFMFVCNVALGKIKQFDQLMPHLEGFSIKL